MTRDEEQIRDMLYNSLEPIHAHDSIYTKVMFRLHGTKKQTWNFFYIVKRVIPLTLVLLLTMGMLFPVFGKEGTLIDIYNSYRVHRSLNEFNQTSNQGDSAYREKSIGSYYLNTLLEKDYGIEPGSLLQIKAQNPDDRETVALIIISKLSNRTPEEILSLRRQNMNWGRILAYYRINPREAIFHFVTLRNKIFSSLEKKFMIRGTIDSINEQNGIFYFVGIPFPIQVTIDTEKPEILTAGSIIAAEVIDYGDAQNIQALRIQVLKEESSGVMILKGEVLERKNESIVLLLSNRQKVRILLSPRILAQPNQSTLRSGINIHIAIIKNMDGNFIAFRWGKIIPLPQIRRQKVQ